MPRGQTAKPVFTLTATLICIPLNAHVPLRDELTDLAIPDWMYAANRNQPDMSHYR